jgi:H+/Cl- antiporter ClcA
VRRATLDPAHDGNAPFQVLVPLVLPALVIGVLASVLLIDVSVVAGLLEDLLWDTVPQALDVSGDARGWILLILSFSGVAVGLVVWKAPGHAGPDPATESLVSPPPPVSVLPGLTLALILMLAGGVSLGPENPLMGIAIGLSFVAGRRWMPAIPAPTWMGLASAGMIGAMFGTPVAAALILTESAPGDPQVPLWSRLLGPLVAAGAGALTTVVLAGETFVLSVPEYRGPELIDLFTGAAIAVVAAILAITSIEVFLRAHGLFQRIASELQPKAAVDIAE